MKLKAVYVLLLAVLTFSTAQAQQIPHPSTPEYQNMKEAGQLPQAPFGFIGTPGGTNLMQTTGIVQPKNTVRASTACNCFQPLDNTFSVVPFDGFTGPEYRNDDGSTTEIPLPFNFCLYGNTFNSVYINNNGNVSFGTDYGTFSANAFPDPDFVMVAPFWADVDTRGNGSGLVYFKITNTALIVRWEDVGYFNSQADKLNDFQLIITNGNDSIIPIGSNVSFCYGDMQWTTGSASSGVGGFGGVPATVGANNGDGVNFVQFGRFDQPGTNYDGPFGAADGVSWLDNQSFFFNVCTNDNNIAPIVSGIAVCDTIDICVGTVYPINFSFLSPEQTQITSTAINAPNGGWSGTGTPGNTSVINGTFTGTNQNIGYNTVTFTGSDNGTPAASTTVTLVINVQPGPPIPQITGSAPFCPGQGSGLLVATPGYQTYSWAPSGGTNDSLVVTAGGQYTVTVSNGGCGVSSAPFTVVTFPNPNPTIIGPTATCALGQAVLSVNGNYTDILWTPTNSNNDSITVGPGTYTVAVTDNNGCNGTAQFTVNSLDPQVNITGTTFTCNGGVTTLTGQATPVGNNYTFTWLPNVGSDSTVTVPAGQYIVTVTDPSGNCFSSDTVTVVDYSPVVNITGIVPFCSGDSILISTDTPFSNYQWYENGQPVLGNNLLYADSGEYIVVVTDPQGCVTADTLVNLDPVDPPVANFSTTPPFGGVQNEPLYFNDLSTPADSAIQWDWTFNGGLPPTSTNQNPFSVFGTVGPTDITLIITTELGCKDTITISTEIVPDIAPNVFTPNGDGDNQYFVLPVAYVKPNCQMYIYNRWGRLIYQTDNYKNDWDGEGHTDGVYYFVFLQPDGKEHHGTVTILRNK